jgi:hypothetical protein
MTGTRYCARRRVNLRDTEHAATDTRREEREGAVLGRQRREAIVERALYQPHLRQQHHRLLHPQRRRAVAVAVGDGEVRDPGGPCGGRVDPGAGRADPGRVDRGAGLVGDGGDRSDAWPAEHEDVAAGSVERLGGVSGDERDAGGVLEGVLGAFADRVDLGVGVLRRVGELGVFGADLRDGEVRRVDDEVGVEGEGG